MTLKNEQNYLFFILIFASIALLIYTGYRSSVLSMTHDESASWRYFHKASLWDLFRNPVNWSSANNHLLNTLLFQQSIGLFGQSDWAVRLPNVLAHLIYLGSSIFIILQLTNKTVLGFAGWILLNLNPYLLDFFSLARGYGLAMGFTMLTFAFFLAFIKEVHWKWALGIFLSIGLSILSNFTQFNFFAASWLVYVLFCLKHFEFSVKKILLWQWPPVLVSLLLGLLLWQPIVWLQGAGEFNWGVNSLEQTFWILVDDSLYGKKYFSTNTTSIFAYGLTALTILALGKAIKQIIQKEYTTLTTIFAIVATLFVSTIIIMVSQRQLLGTQYFIHRTALIFIPIWGMLIFSFLLSISDKRAFLRNAVGGIIIIAGSWHFFNSLNFDKCREWWYDKHTLAMVKYLETKVPPNEQVYLGAHWMFTQSSMYYKAAYQLNYFKKVPYSKKISPDEKYDYYYVFKSNYDQLLTEDYEIEKQFEFACLLRRKK